MPVVAIVTGEDHPSLRAKSKVVESFGKETQKTVDNLLDTVESAEGVGLAAPQIDVRQRLLVAKVGDVYLPLINPEIVWKSDQIVMGEEGCLSLPNVWLMVPRATEIVVKFFDRKGKEQERKLADFNARVVQHEVDHLDGILITDYQHKDTIQ